MSPQNHIKDEISEFEALLPWYVAGTLEPDEMQRMDARLASDPELQALLDLTLEEQHQAITLNEQLGAPSTAALPDLMARIAAEPQQTPVTVSLSRRLSVWFEELTASMSPVAMGASAAAAALVICLQAGLIAGLYFKSAPQGVTYETASHGQPRTVQPGLRALIAFQPQLKAGDLAEFLSTQRLQIIEGPRPGGFYLVRFEKTVSAEAAEKKINLLRDQTRLVRFIALSQ